MRQMIRLVLSVILVTSLAIAGWSAVVKEAATGQEFAAEMKSGNKTLACTGADVRSKFIIKVYAVGHYGEKEAVPAESNAEKQLSYWTSAKVAKAFVLKFTYNVSSKQIKEAWSEGLTKAQYKGAHKTALLESFKQDLPKGSVLKFEATADGQLSAIQNDKVLGTWKDPDLVRALWTIWMGKDTVVNNRENLVKIKPSPVKPATTPVKK